MEEYFRISKNPGFLHVQGSKSMSPSGIEQFFLRIPETARDTDTKKVLVDARKAEGSFSTMERFDYGIMLAKHFTNLQVAIVVHESLRDPKLFGETVAVNRGANVRVFTNLDGARSWLGIESASNMPGGDT